MTWANAVELSVLTSSALIRVLYEGQGALECGASHLGTTQGFAQTTNFTSAKPASYSWYQWYWEAPGNIGGVFNSGCTPVDKGGRGTTLAASTLGEPTGLTFTIIG